MLQFSKIIHARSLYRQFFLLVAIVFTLVCGLLLTPAIGQSTQESAAVVVDGRQIFLVSSFRLSCTEAVTAQERADAVISQLKAVVKSGKTPQVKIQEDNNSPTIWMNGRYLLTVTQNDTPPNLKLPFDEKQNLCVVRLTEI